MIRKLVEDENKPNRIGVLPGQEVIDVNLGDESGYTPLYVAATAGLVRYERRHCCLANMGKHLIECAM